MKTFEQVWAELEKQGYQYGEDALTNVKLGWRLAIVAVLEAQLEEYNRSNPKVHPIPFPLDGTLVEELDKSDE